MSEFKECRGLELIKLERVRQQEMGYTIEHDRQHSQDEFVDAAMCYLTGNRTKWPWEQDSFRPSVSRKRNLIKAGALIAAAINRESLE